MEREKMEDKGKIESKIGRWEAYYARKKGSSHIEKEMPCQDFCLVKNVGNGYLFAAVADGHGGEEYTRSDRGSKLACEILFEEIKRLVFSTDFKSNEIKLIQYLESSHFIQNYLDKWKKAVLADDASEALDVMEEEGTVIRKYGTTLLFSVVMKSSVILGQIGDGAILLFDKKGRNQLFKRHDIKHSSATSSVVSSKAHSLFFVHSMDRRFFDHLLLSTDGIYDKLDTENWFLYYAQELVEQTNTGNTIRKPFQVDNLDVSSYTKDDCTIVLINLLNHNEKEISAGEFLVPYEEVRFVRACGGMEVYTGIFNQKPYELHVHIRKLDRMDEILGLGCEAIKKPIEIFEIPEGRYVYVYPREGTKLRLSIGVEFEAYLEKNYLEECVEKKDFQGNEYWLRVYESLLEFNGIIKKSNISLGRHYQECIFLNKDGSLYIMPDAFITDLSVDLSTDLMPLLNNFGIFGKISCNGRDIPLYKTLLKGQIIKGSSLMEDDTPFCCVVYKADKGVGLMNISNRIWKVEGSDKLIKPNGVLRLNKNRSFSVEKNNEKRGKCVNEKEELSAICVIVYEEENT